MVNRFLRVLPATRVGDACGDVRPCPDHRAIMGYSMGGGHSTSIGFGHPELFAYVGAFSGFGSTNLLTADPAKTNKNYKIIFIGSGTEDTAVNSGRAIHDALTKAGVKHVW